MRDHIVFVNKFVEKDELLEFLGAADVYVTPYLNEAQITSGTLAYALARARRPSPRLTGMRRKCSQTTAASSCPSKTRTSSPPR